MTGYPEVALAREAGLRYASIGIISNLAAGLGDEELTVAEIIQTVADLGDSLHRLIEGAMTRLDAQ